MDNASDFCRDLGVASDPFKSKGAPELKYFNGIAEQLEPISNCSLRSTGYVMDNASNFSRDLGVASDF